MKNCDPEKLIGFMTAPWVRTTAKNMDNIELSMKTLAAAREKFVKR